MKNKKVPDTGMTEKAMPVVGKAENMVFVGDDPIEIKPTKLRYIRNGTANLYRLLDKFSVIDIVSFESGVFGEGDDRDGDKALMDWLIAATDDEQYVVSHYDDMDPDIIYQILTIFKRVNHFVEQDSKNGQSPRTEA